MEKKSNEICLTILLLFLLLLFKKGYKETKRFREGRAKYVEIWRKSHSLLVLSTEEEGKKNWEEWVQWTKKYHQWDKVNLFKIFVTKSLKHRKSHSLEISTAAEPVGAQAQYRKEKKTAKKNYEKTRILLVYSIVQKSTASEIYVAVWVLILLIADGMSVKWKAFFGLYSSM